MLRSEKNESHGRGRDFLKKATETTRKHLKEHKRGCDFSSLLLTRKVYKQLWRLKSSNPPCTRFRSIRKYFVIYRLYATFAFCLRARLSSLSGNERECLK